MTAPVVLRQWKSDALDSISADADAIAEVHPEIADKADALKNASGRDPLHTETYRLCALADLMKAVAEAIGASRQDVSEDERTLEDIDGIGPELADNLREVGLQSPGDLRQASDGELLAVDGVGEGKLKKIRANL